MKKNILVIGAGSAGKRFIALLLQQGDQVYSFLHRNDMPIPDNCIPLTDLYTLPPLDGAIIASPPQTHAAYAIQLINQGIPILIEKPLTDSVDNALALLDKARNNQIFLMPGFNLRFLPIISTIETAVREKIGTLYYALLSAGYYLPLWKPRRLYSETYSAYYNQGGGVALDLIHEIDLACRLFGTFYPSSIISCKLSNLTIDCEDYVQITTYEPFPVQITLDYLSHVPTRIYYVVGSKGSMYCDIYNSRYTFTTNDGTTEKFSDPLLFDIQKTYEQELLYFITHLDSSASKLDERFLGIDALKIAVKARKHV